MNANIKINLLEVKNHTIFSYLRKNWKWCLLTLLVIAEMLAFACLHTEAIDSYYQYMDETSVRYSSMFFFIFFENLKSLILTVAVGLIPLGLGSLFMIYSTVSGLSATAKWILQDVSGLNLFLSILPHGIFEIPSIILSMILSVFLSRAITVSIISLFRKRPVLAPLREDILAIVKTVVYVLIPLILIGAIVESTVSKWMISLL